LWVGVKANGVHAKIKIKKAMHRFFFNRWVRQNGFAEIIRSVRFQVTSLKSLLFLRVADNDPVLLQVPFLKH
jgi:hypothetical protein